MKIYGVLIILLTSTMACVSKPKLKTFKFEKDRQTYRSPANKSSDQCYVVGNFSVFTSDGEIYQTNQVNDAQFSFSKITSKEACMRKAIDLAQEYPEAANATGTRFLGLQSAEATLYVWFSWGFGQFNKGWLFTSFTGEEGQVTRATKRNVDGFQPGDQRYWSDGTKWF